MALKPTTKGYITNMVYGIGAAIVLLGALMKITHFDVDLGFVKITANFMLTLGLITEALIFLYSAFFDVPSGDYSWELAYPELASGEAVAPRAKKLTKVDDDDEVSLSKKLDKMLQDAKLDVALFERLRTGIDGFGSAVSEINKTADAAAATQQYGDQLALAANHMESLNALYQVQLEHGKKQTELTERFITDMEQSAGGSEKFIEEMNKLTGNVNSLNKVYGGMLSAMKG